MPLVLDGTTGIAGPLNGTLGATTPDTVAATSVNTPNTFGFKNRIINGDMRIDQRNAGASVATSSGGSIYTIDRWSTNYSQTSKYTVQQNAGSVTPPVGFKNYLGVTSSSAYSVVTGDYFLLRQGIEGFNTADLGFGTANASTVTISFWVRSSLTGTFSGTLNNSAFDRSYPFTYTISAANTWEQKTITVAGDTTGTWVGATNGGGLYINFSLGAGATYSGTAGSWAGATYLSATGSTSVVGTSGATFYITGVQLEKGSTATSFDMRDYGRELAMCQRYCIVYSNDATANVRAASINYNSTTVVPVFTFPVPLRTTPTGIVSTAASTYRVYSNGTVFTPSAVAADTMSTFSGCILLTCSGLTAGFSSLVGLASGTPKLEFTGTEL